MTASSRAKQAPFKREPELGPLDLALAMGAKSFDALPPWQRQWQAEPGEDPLYRMWAAMCASTIAQGRKLPYAVDEKGRPLDMKALANLLEMDLANTYATWNEGRRKGLWRNRTDAEEAAGAIGILYFCGSYQPTDVDGEEMAKVGNSENCLYTQLPSSVRKRLKTYMIRRIDQMPSVKQVGFLNQFGGDILVENGAMAELTAALRLITGPQQDNTCDDFGFQKIREVHKNGNLTPEEQAARDSREKRIKKLARKLKLYVHTIERVYRPSEPLCKPIEESVQPAAAGPSFNTDTYTEKREAAASVEVRVEPPPPEPPTEKPGKTPEQSRESADQAFQNALQKIVVDSGKGALTPQQLRAAGYKVRADARPGLLAWLPTHIRSLKKAGAIVTSVIPEYLQILQVQAKQRNLQQTAADSKAKEQTSEAALIEEWKNCREDHVDRQLVAMGESAWLEELARHAAQLVKTYPSLKGNPEELRGLAQLSIRRELIENYISFEDWNERRLLGPSAREEETKT